MNNLEDKLIKIKTKKLTDDEKSSIWHGAMVKIAQSEQNKKPLLINILKNYMKYDMKKMIVGVFAVVVILGGGGVVAASNNAQPGDFLFPVDLAVEKVKISLTSQNKKAELKLKFAEERIAEIKHISEVKSVPISLVADLSATIPTSIEVDVFTNETLVKIEAGDKKYGYISTLKIKEVIVKEIAEKYSLDETKVNELINFQTEDRTSGADDKKFLNKTHAVNFSDDESKDVGEALTNIEELLNGNLDSERSQKIEQALNDLLVSLGDNADIEVKKEGGEIKIKTDGDKIKVEIKDENKGKSEDSKDSNKSGKDKVNTVSTDPTLSADDILLNQKGKGGDDDEEDDSKEFCRGEWRDPTNCNDDSSDDLDDDNGDDSISGGSDIEDDGNSGGDDDDDSDEDNGGENSGSGHGGGDDEEDD